MDKRSFTYLVSLLVIVWIITPVFALSSEEKASILSSFKQKEEELIFEWEFDLEDFSINDLFKTNNRAQIYENIRDKVQSQKSELETQRENILDEMSSLEDTLEALQEDILSLSKETNKINSEIVSIKEQLKSNETEINILTEKIKKSTEVIIEYLVYLYKKWNLIYTDWEIDNLKAIIMNSGNLDDILWDVYYKELISLAWKKLIEKHKKYIFSLYVEQKNLEESSKQLKHLRKDFIIKKKVLDDKKEFKVRMLEISRWKNSLYKKYIEWKIDIEKELRAKTYKEKIKFNEISKELLVRSWCKYVDLSRNTTESRNLEWECLNLNKLLYAESRLTQFSSNLQNVFSWPVLPTKWISAYFKDEWYKKDFWVDHDWVDIVVDQWTDIVAPADWYVVYIEEPDNPDYAFIAIKHTNWFVSVYGHVSKVLVNKYDIIKAWEVFAKSGWEYGSFWAWFLTTWPHLHFQVFKDKERKDPLEYLNISLLSFDNIQSKYKLKYYTDYKERTWKEFADTSWWRKFKLDWHTEVERQKNLLEKYARSDFRDWNMWVEESLDWNIDPTFAMCIGLAETTLWNYLKTSYNIWNVWNTDSWWTWDFENPRSWIYWIWKTLNNKYLWNINNIWLLSWAGREALWAPNCNSWPNTFCYATDRNHWHNNVIKCMSFIKGKYISDDYNFRL